MSIILAGKTSAEYWRLLRMGALRRQGINEWLEGPEAGVRALRDGGIDLGSGRPAVQRRSRTAAGTAARNARVLEDAVAPTAAAISLACAESPLLADLSQPWQVIVAEAKGRRTNRSSAAHVATHVPPAHMLFEVAEGVFVCAPELNFVQLARELSQPKLIRYGMELCGGYALSPGSGLGFENCLPIATPANIEQCIDVMSGAHGIKQARGAARYVRSAVASPAEADTGMQLCLPRRDGGYGCPWPEFNARVDIPSRAGSKHSYRCDLLWRDARLAIEYNGFEPHSSREARCRDSRKLDDLAAAGVQVLTVVADQARDAAAMEQLARGIYRRLGKHWRTPDAQFHAKHAALCRELYSN